MFLRSDAVELPGVRPHRGVAALSHVGEDPAHRFLHRRILRGRVAREVRELRVKGPVPSGEPAQFHRALAFAKASINGCSAARLVLSAAWLTIRRADTGMISSTATRPFALSVLPVDTRSTMASASPTSGASSIEP